jgi:hypothetical protein
MADLLKTMNVMSLLKYAILCDERVPCGKVSSFARTQNALGEEVLEGKRLLPREIRREARSLVGQFECYYC